MEANFHIGKKPVAGDLVISEIHYRPASPSDEETAAGFNVRSAFEFIELYNRSDYVVSLSEVALTNGVRFEFSGADVTELAPGELAVVVGNRKHRYGTGLPVAGEFDGFKLSDSGETLRLSLLDGVMLQEMRYNDKEPWPEGADGSGPSLTLKAPRTMTGNDAADWKESAKAGGSPGTMETNDPADADQDRDGLTALMEEALGTSDADSTSGPSSIALKQGIFEVDGKTASHWTFQTTRNPVAEDFDFQMEMSSDLEAWEPSDNVFERVDSAQAAPGKLTWRSRDAIQEMDGGNLFVRLRVTRQ